MSTVKTKKKIRRRQQRQPKRQNPRRHLTTSGATATRPRSATDSARSGPASSGSGRPTPAALARSQGQRNLLAGRPEARRARANATADINPYSPPKISKPAALQRQNANRDLGNTNATKASDTRKTKRDFTTGRTLFPVDSGGKTQYLPIYKEATKRERKLGLFVDDASVQKDPANTPLDPATVKRASLRDHSNVFYKGGADGRGDTGRTLFATESADGKRDYLPRESEATAAELSQGKYVPDAAVEVPPIGNQVLNKRPVFDFNGQRNLFATRAADDGIEYLPKKSDATALELSQGRYVADTAISAKAPLGADNAMSNKTPRYDIGKGREVFAVETPDGTRYLPSESDASGLERARGLFIPDNIVDRHEAKRRRTALRDDSAAQTRRRAQRADKLPGGVARKHGDVAPEPVHEATDGTALWDGFSPPEVSDEKQRETLAKLRPKYDLGKGRMVYPTETAPGRIEYLPLEEDASTRERIDGLYAAFVPHEPLPDFLENQEKNNRITRRDLATERGEVSTYTKADIEAAFEQAPNLVLRSAQLVSDSARQTPELQQQFSDT